METTTNIKTNRYAAKCSKCGSTLKPGAGRLVSRGRGGRWNIICVDGGWCGRTSDLAIRSDDEYFQPWDDTDAMAPAVTRDETLMIGRTWDEVLEDNEYFDGEPEPTAAAHQTWVIANARYELQLNPNVRRFLPYLDTRTAWGDPSEAIMHAMDAWHDRHEA